MAAYSSIIFPLAGALGAIFAGWASDRWFKSQRAPCAAICLAVAGLLAYVYCLSDNWAVSSILLAGCGAAAFGAHVLIVGAAPMDYAGCESSVTGFIDAWGYVGAGATGLITGLLVDKLGWASGFGFWAASAFAGALILAILYIKRSVRVGR